MDEQRTKSLACRHRIGRERKKEEERLFQQQQQPLLLFLLHSSPLAPFNSSSSSSSSPSSPSSVRSFIRRTAKATVVVPSSVSVYTIEPHHLLALPCLAPKFIPTLPSSCLPYTHCHLLQPRLLLRAQGNSRPCLSLSSRTRHATFPSSLSGSLLPRRSFNSHLEGHGKGNWCRNRSNFRGGCGYQVGWEALLSPFPSQPAMVVVGDGDLRILFLMEVGSLVWL